MLDKSEKLRVLYNKATSVVASQDAALELQVCVLLARMFACAAKQVRSCSNKQQATPVRVRELVQPGCDLVYAHDV